MPVLLSKKEWPLVTQEANMKKGPLVKVQIGKGQFVKMYEVDAIAKGLIPAKAKPAGENKMKAPQSAENKAVPEEHTNPEYEVVKKDMYELIDKAVEDFTQIPGIGKATARSLAAHGISNLEELRQAGNLDYLTPKMNEIIEEWRNG